MDYSETQARFMADEHSPVERALTTFYRRSLELETEKRDSLCALLAELDGELDRQLYDDEYVRQCRNNGLDIPDESEHHVIITQKMRRKIQDAAKIAADDRLRWVPCEACGGSGEIIWRDPVGPYDDPGAAEYSEICAACEGTGRDCAEPKLQAIGPDGELCVKW